MKPLPCAVTQHQQHRDVRISPGDADEIVRVESLLRSSGAGDGDDAYLCYVAQKLGFGEGLFPELKLQHLIPKERFNPDYFVRIARGNAHVAMLLMLRDCAGKRFHRRLAWPVLRFLGASIIYHGMKRRVCGAQARGEIAACLEYRRECQRPGA